ncbi:MAG: ArsR family transcriptional regulator [Gemmatimonadetes bacterium]|nr:MAG: ArsR family transcriptional regulator [Gemmatimonadota bacterium]
MDTFVITDVETLKVLADPLRLKILEYLHVAPSTAKQLAQQLDVAVNKLYYHLNLLEKHHLITVVDTRVVSGIIEKKYAVVANVIRVDKSLLNPVTGEGKAEFEVIVREMFDHARQSFTTSWLNGWIDFPEEGQDSTNSILQFREIHLTPAQARDIHQRLRDLIDETARVSRENQQTGNGLVYNLFISYHPTSELTTEEDNHGTQD